MDSLAVTLYAVSGLDLDGDVSLGDKTFGFTAQRIN